MALNLCLLMTHYGVKEDGPSNPNQIKTLQKAMRHKRASKAAQARIQLSTMPTLISFKQEIKFSMEANRTSSTGDDYRIHGDGTPKKPHWRKSYFKQQPIGPGLVERKLIFIAPVFVNRKYFFGDLKDTKVVYKGENK